MRAGASKFCAVIKESDSLLTQGCGNGNVAAGLEGREGALHQTCSEEFLQGWPSLGTGRALLLLRVAAGLLVGGTPWPGITSWSPAGSPELSPCPGVSARVHEAGSVHQAFPNPSVLAF